MSRRILDAVSLVEERSRVHQRGSALGGGDGEELEYEQQNGRDGEKRRLPVRGSIW